MDRIRRRRSSAAFAEVLFSTENFVTTLRETDTTRKVDHASKLLHVGFVILLGRACEGLAKTILGLVKGFGG